MGKFQLDYKGQASVSKFHEKHSAVKSDKAARIAELRKKQLEKQKQNKKN